MATTNAFGLNLALPFVRELLAVSAFSGLLEDATC
ncbi:hypothetical protein X961_5752 [Burkholderia pseudomallei MSHR5613]|nr:hypothetical protein X961_5752 [Burkholderia pseudomallei MSHR5613]KGX51186.1 hypothetical protein Y025_5193 [Burkholderia pseudomallei TSV32]